ncbi:MAG: amidohydrolase family protein [Alphaproteobacteria bacterium]|jgi:hypothetical protein|nr:amidohydrolase family protein [Alphaproteobacteria bacterium]
MKRRLASAALALALAIPATARSEAPLPIFDAHLHYSHGAWAPFGPAAVIDNMDKAGVPRALVSSTPDDGTLTLYQKDGSRFVPVLRPYRDGVNSANWHLDAETPAYLARRLKRGIYAGIGEFHLFDAAAAGAPVVAEVVRLALARDIFVHVHSGPEAIEALFRRTPKLKVIWAHAGMTSPPQVIGRLLAAHRNLWTELSFRGWDVAPDGGVDPEWRQLLLRHPDRFMIGTDTYVNQRWDAYQTLVAEHRHWLGQLPPKVAKAIAYGNAVRLFGTGGRPALAP